MNFNSIANNIFKQLLTNEASGTIEELKKMFSSDEYMMNIILEICQEQEEALS